ncbi:MULTISPECIES: type I-F CRISPR-associated endoribonuclease Cas6/Csy4 [Colwellia]|uniref:Type I-F CRISPR-associated endoribonuclease Cas6/Csy4 n=1 Tax=Colwellia marinimaniae TaxID=1513592 RepID=A0ABQ0MQK4_9GAMM|nr:MULTISPECIES: type I-F CRISPR-associated endoribonuclease Cas6/Csy4 [Colwellia]GAW94647.1 type I-F CRISPR-associated endoribonuclease Cas6/Csy4 [Colwellia marinimaniae]
MNHYIDIRLKPDAEMRENVLMNTVYSKLHKALVILQSTSIGISFPKYKVLFGNVLRIHGEQSYLNDLQGVDWLGGIKGYCKLSDVLSIPEMVQYRTISRKQANMTEAKLRRLITRKSITKDEVKLYKAKMFSQGLDNAYLELVSSSTGEKHRRYIQFGELKDTPVAGDFDSFGLSKQATVPWF